MNEGWSGEEYLILFSESEIAAADERYTISKYLPGYRIIGIRGWDDFIVQDQNGAAFTVPAIPIRSEYLAAFKVPDGQAELTSDDRFTGKIKWYLRPVIFDGSAEAGPNLTWVDHNQHGQLVRWWNETYRSVKK